MAARLDVPVVGTGANPYGAAGRWHASLGWRYQRSFRHFVGRDEQENRETEQSQVINTIHLADVGVRYSVSARTSVSLGVPYLMATRSSPIRNGSNAVIDRSLTHARAISDIVLTGRRWMLDPASHGGWNVSLGLGFKLPTGPSSVVDARQSFSNGNIVTNVQVVDQSIQPGDGGFGVLLDLQTFWRPRPAGALYLSATYLANPQGTNGVRTFRSRASEAEMSVADQYVLRSGGALAVPRVGGLSMSAGIRLEGVPVEDLVGPSTGFRRPGFAFSIEPGLACGRGRHSISVTLPVALVRDRLRSVPDRQDGRHGDAAFADWVLLTAYTRAL